MLSMWYYLVYERERERERNKRVFSLGNVKYMILFTKKYTKIPHI